MRVYLGSDHAGYELKDHLVAWLTAAGHQPVDCGPHIYDAEDDYPVFCNSGMTSSTVPVRVSHSRGR
jgi:ribose 5-phosphate isomerase B